MTGQAGAVPFNLTLSVHGQPVEIAVEVPDGQVRLDELLPPLWAMDDRIIDASIAHTEASGGGRVSCAKGCSACCRSQPVPVTPPEAYALARLVETLPEPRRTAVLAVFAHNLEKLREAGLYEVYMRRDAEMSREEAHGVALRYMALRLACPFLDDEGACGIYLDRPFVCRQYLVTSPPELCDMPLRNRVRPVPMLAFFAGPMLEVAEKLTGKAQYTVPLALALEKARADGADLEARYDSRPVFEQLVRAVLKP